MQPQFCDYKNEEKHFYNKIANSFGIGHFLYKAIFFFLKLVQDACLYCVKYVIVWFKFSCQMLCFCAQWLYLSMLHRLLKPSHLFTRQLACHVVCKGRSFLIFFWMHSSMICWRPRTCFSLVHHGMVADSYSRSVLEWGTLIVYARTWLDKDLTNQSPDWRQLTKSKDKWILIMDGDRFPFQISFGMRNISIV